jgi:hypothetical protein
MTRLFDGAPCRPVRPLRQELPVKLTPTNWADVADAIQRVQVVGDLTFRCLGELSTQLRAPRTLVKSVR